MSKTLSGAPVVPDVWWIRVYAASGKVQLALSEAAPSWARKELCLRGERQASKVPECAYFTWRDTRGIELLGDEPVTAVDSLEHGGELGFLERLETLTGKGLDLVIKELDVQWSGSMRQGRAAMVLVMRKQ